MPVEIDLGMPPAGYSLTAARPEEDVAFQFQEFTSTEDGQHFIQRLEGIPDEILRRLSPKVFPSQVDNLLAICDGSGKATVYLNEITLRARMRASGPVHAGQPVTKNDIVEVDRLELGVELPDDAGVVFLFSVGWRKGLFYDFGPLVKPNPLRRQYDIAAVLGQAYCYVLFQERFTISDREWDALFAAKWFPFAGLHHESIDALIGHVRSGWDPDQMLDDVVARIKERLPLMLDSWRNHSSFAPHFDILARAADRFQNDDFVSCTGLLFPRIEGILRTHHTSLGTTTRPSPANLTKTAVASKLENEKCLLLPHRFATYLSNVYFADFNPVAHDINVSRHSVAHGVASASEFNKKSAMLAILVVHQLFYFLENKRSEANNRAVGAAPEGNVQGCEVPCAG
ncbi:MAG: hypothetical protein DCC68_08995 [Planctomycetota bacterium]|nr:MAG: hypothetical protein DCC68_08995 [Planctomycetota bacterium]